MSQNINIAIIDDEAQILDMMKRYLERNENYTIKTYNNPLNAVGAVKNEDVIFLDIMMPQLDGLEALKRIKATNPSVKVIMMTAYSSLDRVLESHKIGAHSYLLKPFKSLSDITKKVEEALG